MNSYVCYYRGQRIEVQAATSYEAQQKAIPQFDAGKRKKVFGHEISVCLAEIGGQQVTHSTGGL